MAKYTDDILFIAGLILLAIGLWLLSPEIALIVIGSILALVGLIAAWKRGA